MHKANQPPYRFGAFVFEPSTLVLKRDAQIMALKYQSAAVLGLLVEHAGEVVTRGTIRDTIWHDRTIEFDHGINACIRDIRRALGDNSKEPAFIETVPKVGYRFIGDVKRASTETSLFRPKLLGLVTVVVAVLFATFWFAGRPQPEPQLRMAVMPFRANVNADLNLQQMSVYAATQLSQKQALLEVISVSELFGNPDNEPGMGDVSRWLDVDYLVAGNITVERDMLILNLRLIRTDGYVHVWSQSEPTSAVDVNRALQKLTDRMIKDMPTAIDMPMTVG